MGGGGGLLRPRLVCGSHLCQPPPRQLPRPASCALRLVCRPCVTCLPSSASSQTPCTGAPGALSAACRALPSSPAPPPPTAPHHHLPSSPPPRCRNDEFIAPAKAKAISKLIVQLCSELRGQVGQRGQWTGGGQGRGTRPAGRSGEGGIPCIPRNGEEQGGRQGGGGGGMKGRHAAAAPAPHARMSPGDRPTPGCCWLACRRCRW